MANVKISQLTPKGSNLEATDLIEISEFDGSGYVTRSITGQEIIDSATPPATQWGDITGVITDQTDLQTELDGKFDVPTGDTTQYLDGAGTPTPFPALASADKMVTVGRNATGSTLYKGTIVYISGSTGNRPNFVKAQANSEATSAGTFGVIEADIPNNSDGNCVTIGTIENLDTRTSATHPFTIDTLADGDTIYLSPLVAGYVTNVKPSAPYHMVYVGKVVRTSPTNGTIVYRIQNGYELNEIHDVAITSIANNDIIQYDSATSLWKNESLSTAGIQPTLVSGTNIKTVNSTSLLGSGDVSVGVTDVTGSAPISSTGGATPDISITQAGATDDGYLSTGDWNAFNNKQDALVSGVSIKTINGSSVLGSGDLVVGGGGGGTHVIVKPQTGNQVSALIAPTNSGFNVGAIGFRMQAFPFYPASSFTCSSLTLNVTTLIAGGIARILIYSDLNGKPSVKLYESANLDCSTTGLKTASTTFNFVAGTKYWITVQSNNASIAFTLQPQNFSTIVSSFGLATRYTSYILASIAIGSAPATWTGGTLHAFEFPFVYITSA